MSLNFKSRSSGYLVSLDSMEGACCGSDGSCEFTTASACYSESGNRFFHNLTCDLVDCTSGVCCNNGFCSKITEQECIEQGGVYHLNTDCATKRCWEDDDTPHRACCFETGACSDLHPAHCVFLGGVPQDVGSSCDTVDCSQQETGTGACCVDGVCYGEGVGPDGNDYPNGFTAGDCAEIGGVYGGAGSTCDINDPTFGGAWPCTFPTGAACFGDEPLGGVSYCIDGISYDRAINELGAGAWQEGVTCGDVELSGINGVSCKGAAEGACCTPQKVTISLTTSPFFGEEVISGYTCTNLTEAACESYATSVFQGEETECDTTNCCENQGDCDATLGCCSIVGLRPSGTYDTLVRCAYADAQAAGSEDPEQDETNYYRSLLECQEIFTEETANAQENGYLLVLGDFRTTSCRDLAPPHCPEADTTDYEYNFCIFTKDENGLYQYYTCEKGTVNNLDDIPTAPTGSYPADAIFSPVSFVDTRSTQYAAVGEDLCTICTDPSKIYLSACCRDNPTTSCETIVNNHFMGKNTCDTGNLYKGLQCEIDCFRLPCCDDTSIDLVGCLNKQNYDGASTSKRIQLTEYSECIDKDTMNLTSVSEELIAQYASNVGFDVSSLSYRVTNKSCEDCELFGCGRNRGSCCFNGTPVHNLTQEECKFLGGFYAGCTGRPFDSVKDAFNYEPPEIDCAEVEPSGTLQPPQMVRGIATRQVNDMERYRRGPFSDVDNIRKAVSSDWETNGWTNGQWKTDELFWPQKPIVQIFWSAKNP